MGVCKEWFQIQFHFWDKKKNPTKKIYIHIIRAPTKTMQRYYLLLNVQYVSDEARYEWDINWSSCKVLIKSNKTVRCYDPTPITLM